MRVLRWADNNLLDLKWEEIGEHYGRYRLHVPEAERAMARSLERWTRLRLGSCRPSSFAGGRTATN